MNRKEAVELFNKISNLKNKEYNKFLLYSIMKTKIELKKIFDEVIDKERVLVQNPRLIEFERSRISILEKYSEKDEFGKPIISNNRYEISPENSKFVNEEISKLQETFREDIRKQEDEMRNYDIFVSENITINISKTNFKNLPDNLSPEDFEVLMNFVDDTELAA